MIVGFNYPWSTNAFGSQIGPNLHVEPDVFARYSRLELAGELSSIPLPPLFDHLDRNLANLKRMGVRVVRWFLLGNGNNYGPPPTLLPPIGLPTLKVYQKRYKFIPPSSVDKRFRRDFAELLSRFRKAGIQLIPSLMGYQFGGDIPTGLGPNGMWYGGRAYVIRDPTAREVFLETMLAELLAASKGFEKEIYAWEVINEPIWLCIGTGPLSTREWLARIPEATIPEMSSFLKEAITRIEKSGFRSTVGHRYFDDLRVFPTGTVPQFHYYADDAWYNRLGGAKNDPPLKGLFKVEHKPILGEFNSPEDDRPRWKYDSPKADSTLARLQLLETEGCDLALIWPDMSDKLPKVLEKHVLKLEDKTRAGIVAYTGGKAPSSDE